MCFEVFFYLLASFVVIPIGLLLEIEARAGRFLSGAMQLHSQLIAVLHSQKFHAWKVSSAYILLKEDC